MIETTEPAPTHHDDPQDDHLWRQLKSIPAFRALLRAVEARFYQVIDLPKPVLDLGCGDGHFAEMTFSSPISVGIDPWWGPLQKAQRSGMYDRLVHGMGNDMPFPDESFASIFSNSVLEHIPNIQPVLNEASRVLQPEGKLVMTMPSHYFTQYMGGAAFFERLGSSGLADRYRHFFNYISRHAHTDAPEVWAERLGQAGFEVERWQYYFSQQALRALEIGHAQGLPSAIMHALTGHWIVAPWQSSLQRTERWLRPFYEEPFNPDEGAYLLIIARKRANHPIEAALPPARPFTLAELEPVVEEREPFAVDREPLVENNQQSTINNQQQTISPENETITSSTRTTSPPQKSNILTYTLILVSLFAAMVGQSRVGSNLAEPSLGFGWFVFSAIPLLILGWQHKLFRFPSLPSWRLPTVGQIPTQRWLALLGFLFSFAGYRYTSMPGAERPFAAILAWIIGIGITIYAFTASIPMADEEPLPDLDIDQEPAPQAVHHAKHTILIAIALFIAALVVRSINLSTHPFILNGIESSIGLDALNVARGTLRNPFATGWLTNPTLPAFLLALPVKILGPSTLSIRLWSPIIGALTVTAVFLIGQKLFDRAVGLLAAVLLAGSHFHLHYSRMGMTNIWDPLLTLLALGTITIAWNAGRQHNSDNTTVRRTWIIAGLFTGLNAYFYTSSHLLPIMLAALLAWMILFDRQGLRQNGRHLLVTAVLAFIVALPQILFYRNDPNPNLFMQRALDVGIFAGQTDWLTQEAARSAQTTTQVLIDQIWRGLLGFSGSVDRSPAYRPLVPLLSFGSALFFMLGLITAVFKSRSIKYAVLLIWFVVTALFAGAFLLDTPNSHRLVIATPALMLLAAIALVTYGRFILAVLPDPLNTAKQSRMLPILLGLTILFVAGDLIFYFGTFRSTHNFGDRNTEIADHVSHYLNGLDNDYTAYFYGPPSMYTDFPTIPFLVENFQRGVNLFDMDEAASLPSPTSPNQVYIFLPERAGELDVVQTARPGGETLTFTGYYGNPLYIVYELKSR